jgi:Kef-type K+ transport system membrane component KefB
VGGHAFVRGRTGTRSSRCLDQSPRDADDRRLRLLVPLAFGALAAALILRTPGWIGPKGTHGQVVLGIGMACAVTALPILVLLMEKLGIFRSPLGHRLLRYASFDDVAIWGVLALILVDWERMGRQALFLGAFALAGACAN